MKKKIAFFARGLGLGGIGRACINYVNLINKEKYDVTLFLEKKEGLFLDDIDSSVHIIDFNLNSNKNILVRKFMNFFKLIMFTIKYYHKFDFAAQFATSIKSGAILSKFFSSNNAFWFHGNYWKNQEEANRFVKYLRIKKYHKLVFVSFYSMSLYQKAFPNSKQKMYVINNPIDYEMIIRKSREKINIKKHKMVLLNVGRHEEETKKLTRLIKCVARLINQGYDFEVWLLGSGDDTKMYQDLVRQLHMNKHIKFLGSSTNVYPYYLASDAVLLTSITEGNPVVYLEAKTLNKPIISTDVSDAKKELLGYGIVTENSEEGFYQGLKEFLDKGYLIKKKFDYKKYNDEILAKLYQMIEEKYD